MNDFLRRLNALVGKEMAQMLRDKSNIFVGILLPVILILLFGYGISFDLDHAKVAVVTDDHSELAYEAARSLEGTDYLTPVRAASMQEATSLMKKGSVIGIVHIPVDFDARASEGKGAVQLIVNGVDAQTAKTLQIYVTAALGKISERTLDRYGGKSSPQGFGSAEVVTRMWFNEASSSTWYLVPGLIVLILTIVGAFLASLLIAREWERGTLESLFVSPVHPLEIVLAKVVPYVFIGLADIALCLLAAVFVFEVPMRGSLLAIASESVLYLLVSLLMGLWISGLTKRQFLASQVSLIVSFMPAIMFSGFVFDITNMPLWLQPICHILPATHFTKVTKTLFLAGNDWGIAIEGALILTGYALLFIWLTCRSLKKSLD